MQVLELPEGQTPAQWGMLHGSTFARQIRQLAEIRLNLTVKQSRFIDRDAVIDAARRHLPVLYKFDRALHAELMSIAGGAKIDPAFIVILNHYSDLRDLSGDHLQVVGGADLGTRITQPNVHTGLRSRRTSGSQRSSGPIEMGPPEEGCSSVLGRTPEGSFLAQTWDMHASAEPYVIGLRVPRRVVGDTVIPSAFLLTVTGCLGLAGLNAWGLGICANNCPSDDGMVGLLWPALVRRALQERTANKARDLILSSPMATGHHFVVADPSLAYGIEVSGCGRGVVFGGPGLVYAHTNHFLDPQLSEEGRLAQDSTSEERLDRLVPDIEDHPLSGADDLWTRLGSHDGHPRSLCTHLATHDNPHGTATCAGILMDLDRREVRAHKGCIHGAQPDHLGFAMGEESP
jgi:isopenicillin-N N-acyltransferase like protein